MELDLHAIKKRYSRAFILLYSWSNPPKLKVRRRRRRRGGEWGESILLPRLWGSAMSSPSGVRGRAPAKNEFGAF